MQTKTRRLFAALCLGLAAGPAQAVLIDFENLAAGSPVATIDGVHFSAGNPEYGPLNLVVSDRFDTTSGERYLGVEDAFLFDVFFPLDIVRLVFDLPIVSLAVSFISSPNTPDATFRIETAAGTAVAGTEPDTILPDQGEVYRLAFDSATSFSDVQLVSLLDDPFDFYSFNIDDIRFTPAGVVSAPEPASLALFALALPLLGWIRRRHSVR